jgi:hypothetical protein
MPTTTQGINGEEGERESTDHPPKKDFNNWGE